MSRRSDIFSLNATPAFLSGGGEVGALMRAHDWTGSPLGAPDTWPQSLRTAVDLMLNSKFPMFVAWGPELGFLYNDSYVEVLGVKHPAALGRRFRDIWSEIWHDISPLIDRALAGEATYHENLPLTMQRKGYAEQTWFTFSYSPVRGDDGAIAGMYCACTETTAQVLAERSRIEENERLRRLFEQAPGFMAVVRGPEHVFELTNAAYLQLVGYRDLVGKPAREALPEVAGQGFFELLDQVYGSGQPFIGRGLAIQLQREPGAMPEERLVDFIYQPITDPDGRVTGIFAEGSDVTEATRAVSALRHSEERFRALVDASAQTVWTTNAKGALVDDSPSWCAFTGQTAEQAGGWGWTDAIHPDDREDALRRWNESLSGQTPFDTEFRVYHAASATWRLTHVRALPLRNPDGSLREWVGMNVDITDQREAETALRNLNQTLEQRVARAIAERDRIWRNSQDMLLVLGHDGIIQAVNPAWTGTLGYQTEELVGRHFKHYVHEEDLAASYDAMKRALGGLLREFENRYRHKDGSWRMLSWTAAVEENLLYCVARDVTAVKAAAEALRETEEQLRQAQKMEAVGQLTGGIAHDFNNLLQAVDGNLELIRRLPQETERVRQWATNGLRAVERGAKLTAQLLAFSRAQRLELKPVAVSALIEGLADLLTRTLGPTIDVRLDLGNADLVVVADPTQLEMAILNLAINARDAMPDGGRLTIAAKQRYIDKDAELAPGPYVEVSVTDTGAGMPAAVKERAFDPFFTTKAAGEGTGLGLSQVYGFARQAGGVARIDSTPGQGTCVRLLLRQTSALVTPARPGSAQQPMALPSARATVLVVDDDHAVRSILRDYLQALGYRVIEAADGTTGMAALDLHQPDVLLVDFAMPGKNGAEVAAAARRRRPGLPIIFSTGYADTAAIEAAGGPHAEILRKPFGMDELGARIERILAA